VIVEPKPRKDGTCYVCRKPITARSKYAPVDAFCMARCCRIHFGCELPIDKIMDEKSVLAQRIEAGKK